MLVSNKKVFLIDSENVSVKFIENVFNQNCEDSQIVVFYTDTSIGKLKNLVPMEFARVGSNLNIEFRHCHAGTNSLDFNLVAYLGSLVPSMRRGSIIIVSNDFGFDTVIYEYSNSPIEVKRLSELYGLVKLDNNSSILVRKALEDEGYTTLESARYKNICVSKIRKDLGNIGLDSNVAAEVAILLYDNILKNKYNLNCAEIKDIYSNIYKIYFSQQKYTENLLNIKRLYTRYMYTGVFVEDGITASAHKYYVDTQVRMELSTVTKALSKFRLGNEITQDLVKLVGDCIKKGCTPSKHEVRNIFERWGTNQTEQIKRLMKTLYPEVKRFYTLLSGYPIFQCILDKSLKINYKEGEEPLDELVEIDAVEEFEEVEVLDSEEVEVTEEVVVTEEVETVDTTEKLDVNIQEVKVKTVDTTEELGVKALKEEKPKEKLSNSEEESKSVVYKSLRFDIHAGKSNDLADTYMKLDKYTEEGNSKCLYEVYNEYGSSRKRVGMIITALEHAFWEGKENSYVGGIITSIVKYCKRYKTEINSKNLCKRIMNLVGDSPLEVELYYKLTKDYLLNEIKNKFNKELTLEDWREGLMFYEV